MGFVIGLSAALTFILGTATAAAFYLVGGHFALMGPYVVTRSWPIIYTVEAVFAVLILLAVTLLLRDRLTTRRLVFVVIAAWIGQLVVLESGLPATELIGGSGILAWLLATGGPIQPLAAMFGGWLGLRSRGGRASAV